MTEKHGCEWELRTSVYVSAQIFKCKVLCCNKKLTVRQAEEMLNEYDALKQDNAVLIKRLWDYEHQASDERIRDEK